MQPLLTPKQQALVDRAAKLADSFAERAAEHDRDNTFPHQNYDDLREAGFLRLSVPEELGGSGAGLPEILPVLERLAMGDGATALAFTMHLSPLGQWASVWRRTKAPRLEQLLRKAVDGELVWASITSETGLRNDMTDAKTRAVRVEGGFELTGRKSFATNSAVATHCSTTARYEDADGGPRLLLCQIALDAPGVTIHQTWNTMGMRGTQSNDVELDKVFVEDAAVVHSLPVKHLDSRVLETVWAWAMPAFSAVYTGIAAYALDWTVQTLIQRGKAEDPVLQDVIGECQILLESSRALIYRQAEEVTSRMVVHRGHPRRRGPQRDREVHGGEQRGPGDAAAGRCTGRDVLHEGAAVRAHVARRAGEHVHADGQPGDPETGGGERAGRANAAGDRSGRDRTGFPR